MTGIPGVGRGVVGIAIQACLFQAPQRAFDEPDAELSIRKKAEEQGDSYHISARHLLYPNARIMRFPVPNEKVPWEVSISLLCTPYQVVLGSGGGEEVLSCSW